jgi:hypothetical protein
MASSDVERKKKIVKMYKSLIKEIVDAGIRDDFDSVESNLQEIVQALELNLIPRKSGTQGFDAKDQLGNSIELKRCTSNLKKQANLNVRLPQTIMSMNNVKEDKEVFWAILTSFQEKGNLLFTHSDHSRIELDVTYYSLLICKFFAKNRKIAINFGAKPCTECHKIHRLQHFKNLEPDFLKEIQQKKLTKDLWLDLVLGYKKEEIMSPVSRKCK